MVRVIYRLTHPRWSGRVHSASTSHGDLTLVLIGR